MEAVIRKIQKLLSLATSSNKHEAEAAATKAYELCLQHNLKIEEVASQKESKITSKVHTEKCYFQTWERKLSAVVAHYTFCGSLVGYHHLSFVGSEANVIIAQHLYDYLVKTINRIGKEFSKEYKPSQSKLRNYKSGLVHGIDGRLVEIRASKLSSDEKGLIYDAEANARREREDYYKDQNIGSMRNRLTFTDPSYFKGVRDSESISLSEQLTGEDKSTRLDN